MHEFSGIFRLHGEQIAHFTKILTNQQNTFISTHIEYKYISHVATYKYKSENNLTSQIKNNFIN